MQRGRGVRWPRSLVACGPSGGQRPKWPPPRRDWGRCSVLGGRGRLCAELKRYAARSRQTAPDCAGGADCRRLPRPLCELCGLPRPGVGRGVVCGGGWLCGCAAAPFRVCAAQFAGRPKTGGAAAPAKARGSPGPPCTLAVPPCGGGQPSCRSGCPGRPFSRHNLRGPQPRPPRGGPRRPSRPPRRGSPVLRPGGG